MADTNLKPKRLRVAVVYPFFPHYREPIIRELIDAGEHDYLFIADKDDPGGSIKAADMVTLGHFETAPCIRLFGGRLLLQRGLIKTALRRDIDVIIYHGGMYWPMMWVSAAIARLTGKRIYNWTHGWVRQPTGYTGLIRRWLYRLMHGTLLYGHLGKVIGIGDGFDPKTLHVIYNSLNYPQQERIRAELDPAAATTLKAKYFSDSERPMLICTSRLTSLRRLDLLLDAMVLLARKGTPVNLMIVGDGSERANLERKAQDLHLDVYFYGACYDEEVLGSLITAAHATVSPGAIGLTAMHSMAYGTPVITHDDMYDHGPEVEAIIPGCTGDIFRKGDTEDLAKVIQRWMREPKPPESIRRACIEVVARFYNPRFQRLAIERAIEGKPADDLFWMKEDVGSHQRRSMTQASSAWAIETKVAAKSEGGEVVQAERTQSP